MILLIDNYDSFTYNLYQYLAEIAESQGQREEIRVFRNDRFTLAEVEEMNPECLIISPGPGRPERAGIILELIRRFQDRVPILGVCLGHQAIGVALGAKLGPAKKLMHGKVSMITHNGKGIFSGLGNPFAGNRYHSLALEGESLPAELEICAWSEDREVMGIRHRERPLFGVQFHPESILTPEGKELLRNFLNWGKSSRKNGGGGK